MSTKNDGGPAFPGGEYEPQNGGVNDREPWNHGMSLRDWFAGQALGGFTAGSFWSEVDNEEAAKAAYAVADAMLAEREK